MTVEWLVARSADTVVRSVRRLHSAEERLRASRRRSWTTLRGGSVDGDTPEPAVREWIRKVFGTLAVSPTIYAGRSVGASRCDCCGHDILAGAQEYELVLAGVSFRLDRLCFAVWQEEYVSRS
jgi:hypothetical protein